MSNADEPREESAAARSGQGAEAKEAAARRKPTRALMEAGEKFHALVRDSAYAYVELDLEGNITSANRRAAEATGYTVEELVTLNLRELILPKDLERALGDLEKALALPNAGPREYRARRRDGAVIDVEVNTLPLKKGDTFVGYQITATDITARKRAEEALRESREELRYIIDNTWDIIFRIDLEGNYTFANKAAERLAGYSGDELLSMNMLQLIAPEHQQFVLGRLKKRMAGDTLEQPFDFEIVTKAGERLVVELTTTAIHDKDGKLVGVQGIARDVTERRRAEEALKESEERFRAIFDNATDGILLADLEDRQFHTGNKRICRMLGYTLEELRTLGVADIHPEMDLPRALEQFQRQSEREITVAEDSPVKRKDGSVFYADISAAPVTLGGTTYMLGIFRDITERKRAEEALRRNQERFRALVERGTSVYAIIGPDGTTLYESPSLERVYGWKPEEVVGKSIFDLVHPDDVEFTIQSFGELVQKPGVEKTVQVRYRHKNGTWREIEVTGVNHVDDPAVGGIVLTSHDVTERKRVEEALRESEEFHRTMVNALPEAVTKSDLEGRITYASPQSVKVYGGESADELIGKNSFMLIAPEDRERAMANLDSFVRTPSFA